MADDVSAGVYMEQGGDVLNVDREGGLEFQGRKRHIAKVTLSDSGSSAGDIFSWQNPHGAAIFVDRVVLDVTTEADGAANIDVGTASDASSSSDNLLDGQDIGAAAATFDNIDDQGTNGQSVQRMDANGGTTDHVTGTASSDPSGLVGAVYIYYSAV